jgi:hypothetical protein
MKKNSSNRPGRSETWATETGEVLPGKYLESKDNKPSAFGCSKSLEISDFFFTEFIVIMIKIPSKYKTISPKKNGLEQANIQKISREKSSIGISFIGN